MWYEFSKLKYCHLGGFTQYWPLHNYNDLFRNSALEIEVRTIFQFDILDHGNKFSLVCFSLSLVDFLAMLNVHLCTMGYKTYIITLNKILSIIHIIVHTQLILRPGS